MKSPFPGMDPHLEQYWPDVHLSLIGEIRRALNQLLPSDLLANAEQRVAIEFPDSDTHAYRPDVRVFEPPAAITTFAEHPAGGVVEAPYRLVLDLEPVKERFIRVIEAGTEHVITIIEVISPTNKRGRGLRRFQQKREELLDDGINFVEIDLVRAGDWQELLLPHVCLESAMSTYRVTIRLPNDSAAVYLFPIRLQDPLPEIAIPLRKDDPPVKLALQPLIEQAYLTGRYSTLLDYTKPCAPPLDPEDAAWAQMLPLPR